MPSSARVGMTDPTPGQPDGGAFRGGARGAGVPITTALRGEGRVLCARPGALVSRQDALVCPGRSLCVLAPAIPGRAQPQRPRAAMTSITGSEGNSRALSRTFAEETPNAPDISRAFRFCLTRARPEGFEPPTF
jgi:hypothetical protein